MGSYIAGNRPERGKRSMIKAKANVYKGLKHFWLKHLVPKACVKYKIDVFLMKYSLHVKYSEVVR